MEPEAAAAGTTGPGNTRLQRRRRGVIHRPEVGFFKGGGGGNEKGCGQLPPPEARRCGPGRAGKWRRAATPGGEGARAACGAVAGRARVPPPAAGGP